MRYNSHMRSLESMERATPEFQSLSLAEKFKRTRELSQVLELILNRELPLEGAQEIVSIALERHLAGRVLRHKLKP